MDRNHLTRPSRQQAKIMGHHRWSRSGAEGKAAGRAEPKHQSRTGIRKGSGANSRGEESPSIQGTGIHHVRSHLGLQLEYYLLPPVPEYRTPRRPGTEQEPEEKPPGYPCKSRSGMALDSLQHREKIGLGFFLLGNSRESSWLSNQLEKKMS